MRLESRPEPRDVTRERRAVVCDRPRAHPHPRLGHATRVARTQLRVRADVDLVDDLPRHLGIVLGVEVRELLPVAARRQDVPARHRHHAGLEAH